MTTSPIAAPPTGTAPGDAAAALAGGAAATPDRGGALTGTSSARTRPRRRSPSRSGTAGAGAQAPDDIRDEITPYNIILIGPTGVGKTEIARRLARLAGAPFVKVEASKFTEVGYVGRDVESMVRDLVDAAIYMVRTEREDEVWPQAEQRADERLLDICSCRPRRPPQPGGTGLGTKVFVVGPAGGAQPEPVDADAQPPALPREARARCCSTGSSTTARWRSRSRRRTTRCWTCSSSRPGMEGPEINFIEMLQDMMPKRKKRRTVRVPEARRILIDEELKKLVDMDDVVNEALDRVENHGILFIDEIDKIAGERSQSGPDVSPGGRPARPAADRRGVHRADPLRLRPDRPHPLHRGRRVPRLQAVRPDSRAAGPLPDPGGAARR